jgi:O-antigen/teichoic acid export membrane protein
MRPRAAASRARGSATLRFAPGRLVPAAATVVATPILARLLSPDDFGRLAVLQSVALLAASVVFGWLEATVVRRFSGSEPLTGPALTPLAGAALAGAGGLLAAGAVATAATGSALALLTAAGAVGYAGTLAATALARARRRSGTFTTVAIVGTCTRWVVGLPLVAAGGGIGTILAAWAAGGLLAVLVAGRLVEDRWGIRPGRPRRAEIAFGAPLVLVQTGLLGLALGDRLLLAAFRPPAEIAPYALGYSLVDQAATLVFSVLMAARFPAMMRTYDERGPDAAAAELGGALRDFTAAALPLLLALALFGGDLARLLGGPDYAGADFDFMPYVAAGLFLHGVHQYLSVPLQQQHRTRVWAEAVAAGIAVNVAVNLALIPSLGATGAAVATLAGYGAVVARLAAASPAAAGAAARAVAVHVPAVAAAVAATLATAPWAWYASAIAATVAYALVDGLAHGRGRRRAG